MATMIEVYKLGKKYHLGGQDKYYKTLRESLVRGIKRPFQRLTGSAPDDDEFWALRNVSVTVDEGEVVGIIGRNGAGKSTLLKLLSRITRPTEGKAKLYGRVGSLLEVGTGFHPELSGRENIFLSGNLLGMTRAEVKNKFDEIVDFSGVATFLDTPVKHYSSGMYVRLGFAIAAHLEPEILLVDEVLAVGDAQFQKKCLGKMDDVAQSGRTVLFVSHNMGMIKQICSKAILLENGRFSHYGNVHDVIDKYMGSCLPRSGYSSNLKVDLSCKNAIYEVTDIELSSVANNQELFVGDPLRLTMSLKILQDRVSCGQTIMIRNTEGLEIVSFINNDGGSSSERFVLSEGHHVITCTIPPVLNNGTYVLSLNIWSAGYQSLLALRDVLTFEIKDSPHLRNDFSGTWGGVVRMKATWDSGKPL